MVVSKVRVGGWTADVGVNETGRVYLETVDHANNRHLGELSFSIYHYYIVFKSTRTRE